MSQCLFLPVSLFLVATLSHFSPAVAADGFKLRDKEGAHLDILFGERIVGRYMYAYDSSSSARRHETYKPYLHVFDAAGKAPITKGPGGEFTHHRGIFIGWMKLGFNGKTVDQWGMGKLAQVHEKFLVQETGTDQATVASLVHWNDEFGKPMVVEERTMTFRRAPAPAYALIDFSTKLTAPNGDVVLDADPEHGGVQFRPANEVDRARTVYLFPKESAVPSKDLDYQWVGETFVLSNQLYSVVDLSHPGNPKGSRWSAYRNYGRFGAFFKHALKSGETLALKYRFIVAEGEMPPAATIQKWFNEFAGANDPVPKTTLRPADQPAPKTPAKAPSTTPK